MERDTTYGNIRDFTRGNVFGQLIKLATPLLAIGFIQMTYNLVDLVWIGRLGSRAVAAVGAVGMLMWMMHSVALLCKVSAEVSIGQSVGAKRFGRAAAFASHTTTLSIVLGIFFALVFSLFPHFYVDFFGLEPEIARQSAEYLRIVATGFPSVFLILNFSGIFIGAGRSDIPFYFHSAGLILNIVSDPLLIFGVGFFPEMGVRGAAFATVLSEAAVVALFVYYLKRGEGLFGKFPLLARIRRPYLSKILKLGLPVTAMNIYFALINMNLARTASIYGGYLGLMSQTTGGQIEGVTWNTSGGFSTALGSFAAQNHAARNPHRIRQAFRHTLLTMALVGLATTLSFVFFGKEIFSIFVPEKEAYEVGGRYLLIMGFSQLFMMLELTTQGMFNGIGKTAPPAIVSIVFNTLRVPLAIVIAEKTGVEGVWWAMSLTSVAKGVFLAAWFYLHQKHKNIRI